MKFDRVKRIDPGTHVEEDWDGEEEYAEEAKDGERPTGPKLDKHLVRDCWRWDRSERGNQINK